MIGIKINENLQLDKSGEKENSNTKVENVGSNFKSASSKKSQKYEFHDCTGKFGNFSECKEAKVYRDSNVSLGASDKREGDETKMSDMSLSFPKFDVVSEDEFTIRDLKFLRNHVEESDVRSNKKEYSSKD